VISQVKEPGRNYNASDKRLQENHERVPPFLNAQLQACNENQWHAWEMQSNRRGVDFVFSLFFFYIQRMTALSP